MTYSAETTVLSSIIGFGLIFLIGLVIWKRTPREREDLLLLKVWGYIYLAMFRFSINWLALPLGSVLAWMLLLKAKDNVEMKQRAVLAGFILFFVGFFPLNDTIEKLLYPRDQIKTFMNEDIAGKGFNIHFVKNGTLFESYYEDDPIGRLLYQTISVSLPYREHDKDYDEDYDEDYRLELSQDHDQDRFQKLPFQISDQGEILQLRYENRSYRFRTTPEFQKLFREIISRTPKTS